MQQTVQTKSPLFEKLLTTREEKQHFVVSTPALAKE